MEKYNVFSISRYLMREGIESRLANFVEKRIFRLIEKDLAQTELPWDTAGLDSIFRPIGGHDKVDVFSEKR